MAYLLPNFKSKTAAKKAIAEGQKVTVTATSPFDTIPQNGVVSVEGPHYPRPHTFYGKAHIQNGRVVKIV